MLLAAIVWFTLIRSWYDEYVAAMSTLLLITTPYLVSLSRMAMSEIPTLALIILTTYLLYLYCKYEKIKHLVFFTVFTILSVYAKHTAIFMFPFYFIFFVIHKGIRRILRKDVLIAAMTIIVAIIPLIPLTYKFSHYNVLLTRMVTSKTAKTIPLNRFFHVLQSVWQNHLTIPVLVLSVISVGISFYRRDRKNIIFILWIFSFYLLSVYLGAPTPRHTIYWIPPFCLLAATTIFIFKSRLWKVILSTVLILTATFQFAVSIRSEPVYAHGYEEIAKYVVENWRGDSILYCPRFDTGMFIFFVRKHSPSNNRVVLRADKVLATSFMHFIIDDRIKSPKDIYHVLKNFGVSYVLIEDVEYDSKSLELLRKELSSNNFTLVQRIPIHSNRMMLVGSSLALYEYVDYSGANPEAVLHMNMPIMNDSIRVKFEDLINNSFPAEVGLDKP